MTEAGGGTGGVGGASLSAAPERGLATLSLISSSLGQFKQLCAVTADPLIRCSFGFLVSSFVTNYAYENIFYLMTRLS